MLGGMLAGHDESGGEVVERNGKPYRKFYGMSSSTAMEKHVGGVADYRASEGKTVEVPYRGQVENTLSIGLILRAFCGKTRGKLFVRLFHKCGNRRKPCRGRN